MKGRYSGLSIGHDILLASRVTKTTTSFLDVGMESNEGEIPNSALRTSSSTFSPIISDRIPKVSVQ